MRSADDGVSGLTYARVMRDPQLMEGLVRVAHRARNEAFGHAFEWLAHAVRSRVRRALRFAKVVVLRAGQHVNAALAHGEPRGRRC